MIASFFIYFLKYYGLASTPQILDGMIEILVNCSELDFMISDSTKIRRRFETCCMANNLYHALFLSKNTKQNKVSTF